ncbi:MAG TPA: T9SS type A sorting domain-containing protein, partial [Yeosuana sp.]
EALAGQGSFSTGYNYSFTTSGSEVTFTFELLDDKTGVIAYLWKETPFSETPMSNVSGKIFTKTITGQTPGATLRYACKFAFAGGLAVTKYFSYVVGDACALSTFDNLWKEGFKVYPNPTQNSWIVKTKDIKMSSIKVFDILGKQVLSLKPEAVEANIDASQLKSGLYFAKIDTANGSSSLKLVRQ